ncbi:unnamed protein product [Peniophora sp. CBMAI 1063]|nr:unnamed protein product [Peniophora sp. CBMAI 1063]
MSFGATFSHRLSTSAPSGGRSSFERGIADLECRLRFVSCRVLEWRQYGDMDDQSVCKTFRRYLCDEIEKQILANVKLSASLVRRCEIASQHVPQSWANLKPLNVVAEKLERHIAAGGRHLEVWRDNIIYLTSDYVDAYCMEVLLDLVRDETATLLVRTSELRTIEAELCGIISTAESLGPAGLSIFTTRPVKQLNTGPPSMYGAQIISSLASSGYHTFHAPQRVKRGSAS